MSMRIRKRRGAVLPSCRDIRSQEGKRIIAIIVSLLAIIFACLSLMISNTPSASADTSAGGGEGILRKDDTKFNDIGNYDVYIPDASLIDWSKATMTHTKNGSKAKATLYKSITDDDTITINNKSVKIKDFSFFKDTIKSGILVEWTADRYYAQGADIGIPDEIKLLLPGAAIYDGGYIGDVTITVSNMRFQPDKITGLAKGHTVRFFPIGANSVKLFTNTNRDAANQGSTDTCRMSWEISTGVSNIRLKSDATNKISASGHTATFTMNDLDEPGTSYRSDSAKDNNRLLMKISHCKPGTEIKSKLIAGDMTLITVPIEGTNHYALIDFGNNNRATGSNEDATHHAATLAWLKEQGVTKLDWVLLTHYHSDHFGHMAQVITDKTNANYIPIDKFYVKHWDPLLTKDKNKSDDQVMENTSSQAWDAYRFWLSIKRVLANGGEVIGIDPRYVKNEKYSPIIKYLGKKGDSVSGAQEAVNAYMSIRNISGYESRMRAFNTGKESFAWGPLQVRLINTETWATDYTEYKPDGTKTRATVADLNHESIGVILNAPDRFRAFLGGDLDNVPINGYHACSDECEAGTHTAANKTAAHNNASEKRLAQTIGKVDFFKLNHHGWVKQVLTTEDQKHPNNIYDINNSKYFIDTLNPQIVLVTRAYMTGSNGNKLPAYETKDYPASYANQADQNGNIPGHYSPVVSKLLSKSSVSWSYGTVGDKGCEVSFWLDGTYDMRPIGSPSSSYHGKTDTAKAKNPTTFNDVGAYSSPWSESIVPVSGFASPAYAKSDSWLVQMSSTKRIRNVQWDGTKGAETTPANDDLTQVKALVKSDGWAYTWSGTACGTYISGETKDRQTTATVTHGGKLTMPSGAVLAASSTGNASQNVTTTYRKNYNFTWTANSGYSVKSVKVDGKEVANSGTSGSYSVKTPTKDHTIAVEFVPATTLTIMKKSSTSATSGNESYSLADAEYAIYANQACTDLIATIKTDSTGKATWSAETAKKYYVKETAPSRGYGLDTNIHTADLTAGSKTVSSVEPALLSRITARMPDSDVASGTKISVTDDSGNNCGMITIGEDGTGSLSTNLPAGTYRLKVISAPSGYAPPTAEKAVELTPGKNETVVMDGLSPLMGNMSLTIGSSESQYVMGNSQYSLASTWDVLDASNKILGQVVTDGNGQGAFGPVPVGTIKLRCVESPAGYSLAEQERTGTIVANKTTNITVSASAKTGTLSLIRKTETPSDTASLGGAEYEIRNSLGKVVGTLTTNEDGTTATIDNLYAGEYEIIEIVPPYGYDSADASLTAQVNIGSHAVIEHIVPLPNALPSVPTIGHGGILIKKTSADEGVTGGNDAYSLAGAKYQIKDSTGTVVSSITTRKDGTASTGNTIPQGEYTVTEESPSPGYGIDTGIYQMSVVADETAIIESKEPPMKASVSIAVSFTSGNASSSLPSTGIIVKNAVGTEIATIDVTGDSQPAIITDLPAGTYSFEIGTVPQGYAVQQDARLKTAWLAPGKSTSVSFELAPLAGSIRVKKLPMQNEGQVDFPPLAGAIYGIYRTGSANTSSMVGTLETDDEGNTVPCGNLVPGEYMIKEIIAPNGYALDTQPHTVTLAPGEDKIIESSEPLATIQSDIMVKIALDLQCDPSIMSLLNLSGITFDIKSASEGTVVATAVTDESGIVLPIYLNPGSYVVVCSVPQNSIFIVESTEQEISINAGIEEVTVPVSVKNGSIQIETTSTNEMALNDGSGRTLSGAVFRLTTKDGTTELVGSTDADGIATISDIPAGNYVLEEVIAPNGFLVNKEKFDVIILPGSAISVTVPDDPDPEWTMPQEPTIDVPDDPTIDVPDDLSNNEQINEFVNDGIETQDGRGDIPNVPNPGGTDNEGDVPTNDNESNDGNDSNAPNGGTGNSKSNDSLTNIEQNSNGRNTGNADASNSNIVRDKTDSQATTKGPLLATGENIAIMGALVIAISIINIVLISALGKRKF